MYRLNTAYISDIAIPFDYDLNTWYKQEMYVYRDQVLAKISTLDDSRSASLTYTATSVPESGKIAFATWLSAGKIDNVRVRKYASPEPSVSVGAEKIVYYYSGILQPINADGSSIFKLGSTIPVKFQLTDANGNFITNAVARIYVAKISDGIIGTEMEANSTSNATTGNLFRYDSTSNQYIFNLGTKTLSTGTWQIRIELDDGSSKTITVGLK